VSQVGLDPAKLAFIDETWAKTNMTRLRGRALRGERQLLRSAAHRTMAALWADVQRMPDKITAGDADGYIRHCGYVLQMK
jgi:hypothetical protein